MTAKYEWRDETGLRHPSLVLLDITEIEDSWALSDEELFNHVKVLKVKRLDSFNDVFNGGRLNHRKVKMKGMEFVWFYKVMNSEYYALFVAFRRREAET